MTLPLVPLPCPFCGDTLRMIGAAHDRSKPVTWQHPSHDFDNPDPPCPYAGHAIGHELLPRWNRRSLSYTVTAEGLPRFNDEARGQALTIPELNEFFAWVVNNRA